MKYKVDDEGLLEAEGIVKGPAVPAATSRCGADVRLEPPVPQLVCQGRSKCGKPEETSTRVLLDFEFGVHDVLYYG